MDTGSLLKRIRLNLALTKGESATKIGITDKTYRKYENEGTSIEKFIQLVRKLGASVDATRKTTISIPHSDDIIIEENVVYKEPIEEKPEVESPDDNLE